MSLILGLDLLPILCKNNQKKVNEEYHSELNDCVDEINKEFEVSRSSINHQVSKCIYFAEIRTHMDFLPPT